MPLRMAKKHVPVRHSTPCRSIKVVRCRHNYCKDCSIVADCSQATGGHEALASHVQKGHAPQLAPRSDVEGASRAMVRRELRLDYAGNSYRWPGAPAAGRSPPTAMFGSLSHLRFDVNEMLRVAA